jgi:hypothetical protein
MSRVQIDAMPWGVVQDEFGTALNGLTVQLKIADTVTAATHYSAVTGGTSSTADLVTNNGLVKASGSSLPRYIETGTYDMTVDGVTKRVEATPGSGLVLKGESNDDLLSTLIGNRATSVPGGSQVGLEATLQLNDPNETIQQHFVGYSFFTGTPGGSSGSLQGGSCESSVFNNGSGDIAPAVLGFDRPPVDGVHHRHAGLRQPDRLRCSRSPA